MYAALAIPQIPLLRRDIVIVKKMVHVDIKELLGYGLLQLGIHLREFFPFGVDYAFGYQQ